MSAVESPDAIPFRETVDAFGKIGVAAFTTTRASGDYGLGEGEPRPDALARWHALQKEFAGRHPRFVSAKQVHGVKIVEYELSGDSTPRWERHDGADGHIVADVGGMAVVTIADCVPVFIAHPAGVVALLHAGWRGTAGKIVQKGISRLVARGLDAADLAVHFGPAICGRCYEVSPDVFEQLTGWQTVRNRNVDLRALLSEQVKEMGVRQMSGSPHCTKCDNDRFYSHRAGDAGRQVSVILSHMSYGG